jgi:hypothetical protein
MIRLEEVTLNSPTSLHDFCKLSLPSERAGSELSSTGNPEAYGMAHFELFQKNMDICQTLRKIYSTVWHHSGSASLDADVALLNNKVPFSSPLFHGFRLLRGFHPALKIRRRDPTGMELARCRD